MNAFARTVAAIIAFVLSIMLLGMTIVTATVNIAFSFIDSEMIVRVVQNIDFEKLVAENEELKSKLEKAGIPVSMYEDIIKSDVTAELLTALGDDLGSVLTEDGKDFKPSLTKEKIIKSVADNEDEIIKTVKKYSDTELSDEEVKEKIDKYLDENLDGIMNDYNDFIKSIYEKKSEIFDDGEINVSISFKRDVLTGGLNFVDEFSDSGGTAAIKLFKGVLMGGFNIFLFAIIGALILFIYLLNLHRCRGFLWLGILSEITGFIFLGISAALKHFEPTIVANLQSENPSFAYFMQPVIGEAAGGYNKAFVGCLIIGLILIITFILIRVLYYGKKEKEKAMPFSAAQPEKAFVKSEIPEANNTIPEPEQNEEKSE